VTGDEVVSRVEAHLRDVLGPDAGRAGVTFLGMDPIEVLRFAGDGGVTYVTLGMSRTPLPDPAATVLTDEGPRAELLLSLRSPRDDVVRALAVLAASPFVENATVAPGAALDTSTPLWPGARFTAVLVTEAGEVPDAGDVAFYRAIPMTANEAAFKRVHGAAALEERWLAYGADPRDPDRAEVPLT
jgi:hypothetical protein